MFGNYLKTALRNLIRQKGFSFINIFGLATGMAASILLFLYISYERSFDQFHTNGNNIYRVITHFKGQTESILPRAFAELGQIIEEGSPQVTAHCKVKNESYTIKYEEKEFQNISTLMTDTSFTDFFNFRASRGDIKKALSDPSSMVISTELAERIFGEEDPVGKVISFSKTAYDRENRRWISKNETAKIGAILEETPKNSHLQFEALLPFEAYDPGYRSTFANDVFVYLMTGPNDPDLEAIASVADPFYESLKREGMVIKASLQPLTNIHFGPSYGYDIGPKGNMQLIMIFIMVALFIIIIAIINFINLVTARSEKRAVEASIRKVSGAGKKEIIFQFLGESVLMSLISFVVALVLVEIFNQPFAQLMNREFSVNIFQDPSLVLSLLSIVIIIGLLAGLYPAIMFSRFQPAEIMRGKFKGGTRNPLLRIVLVVIQFVISVILIISITVFNRQVNHLKNSKLGFDTENVLVFSKLTPSLIQGYEALRAELLANPSIIEVGSGNTVPGFSGSGQSLRLADGSASQNISITEYRVRKGYREALGIKLSEGRWFDFENPDDLDNYIVNQATVKEMGLTDPVGKEVIMFQRKGKIIGVVEDFHFTSLKSKINPLMFTAYRPDFYCMMIKTDGHNPQETTKYIEEVFARFDPNQPFEGWSINTVFQNFYKKEEQQNTIFNYASIIAIIIAMLGLFGLSSYIVMARTKEIGIRKVLGASGLQISRILFKDIAKWVILANLIAWPVAWYFMDKWLGNFPYRIDLSAAYFIAAAIISITITAITISGHTLKAANYNPVKAIKSE